MTEGYGAKLTPEQGCVSSLKCIFGDVSSGFYYGSDGLRSPLICTRDPGILTAKLTHDRYFTCTYFINHNNIAGTPEYQGEANPDPSKYNRN